MGRWTQYDEDDYRLPEGMKRVGYDTDTQRYTFREGNQLWMGEPRSRYGTLTRVGTAPPHTEEDDPENAFMLRNRLKELRALEEVDNGEQDEQTVPRSRHVSRMLLPLRFLVRMLRHRRNHSIAKGTPPLTHDADEVPCGAEKKLSVDCAEVSDKPRDAEASGTTHESEIA